MGPCWVGWPMTFLEWLAYWRTTTHRTHREGHSLTHSLTPQWCTLLLLPQCFTDTAFTSWWIFLINFLACVQVVHSFDGGVLCSSTWCVCVYLWSTFKGPLGRVLAVLFDTCCTWHTVLALHWKSESTIKLLTIQSLCYVCPYSTLTVCWSTFSIVK